MSTVASSAGKARVVTFADWKRAAVAGYVAGGASRFAASEVVRAASSDIASLITRDLSDELFKTFVCALDLEAGRFVRRHGAAFFAARD
jgi:hypothetical protein